MTQLTRRAALAAATLPLFALRSRAGRSSSSWGSLQTKESLASSTLRHNPRMNSEGGDAGSADGPVPCPRLKAIGSGRAAPFPGGAAAWGASGMTSDLVTRQFSIGSVGACL